MLVKSECEDCNSNFAEVYVFMCDEMETYHETCSDRCNVREVMYDPEQHKGWDVFYRCVRCDSLNVVKNWRD